jgi:hypothetical protein
LGYSPKQNHGEEQKNLNKNLNKKKKKKKESCKLGWLCFLFISSQIPYPW